jgi:hypothetical protein
MRSSATLGTYRRRPVCGAAVDPGGDRVLAHRADPHPDGFRFGPVARYSLTLADDTARELAIGLDQDPTTITDGQCVVELTTTSETCSTRSSR